MAVGVVAEEMPDRPESRDDFRLRPGLPADQEEGRGNPPAGQVVAESRRLGSRTVVIGQAEGPVGQAVAAEVVVEQHQSLVASKRTTLAV